MTENVTGITSIAGGNIVREIFDGMESLGYRVEMKVLKAEEYGVPQERRRVFFIATRTNAQIRFPEPTHGKDRLPLVTIWDAISDLPPLENGAKEAPTGYGNKPQNSFQALLLGDCTTLNNHTAGGFLLSTNSVCTTFRLAAPGGTSRVIFFLPEC